MQLSLGMCLNIMPTSCSLLASDGVAAELVAPMHSPIVAAGTQAQSICTRSSVSPRCEPHAADWRFQRHLGEIARQNSPHCALWVLSASVLCAQGQSMQVDRKRHMLQTEGVTFDTDNTVAAESIAPYAQLSRSYKEQAPAMLPCKQSCSPRRPSA